MKNKIREMVESAIIEELSKYNLQDLMNDAIAKYVHTYFDPSELDIFDNVEDYYDIDDMMHDIGNELVISEFN